VTSRRTRVNRDAGLATVSLTVAGPGGLIYDGLGLGLSAAGRLGAAACRSDRDSETESDSELTGTAPGPAAMADYHGHARP
jgi:hypothetical protein